MMLTSINSVIMCTAHHRYGNRSQHYSLKKINCCAKSMLEIDLTLKVLVTTIDAQWEGMGDVGLAKYKPV